MLTAWQALCRENDVRMDASGTVLPAEGSRVKQMLACIHSRYSENLNVEMIAESANICARECYRCFRQVLGTTPTLYLMHHRVNAAARMLIETDRSITEIAAACGFSSPSYFCKVFRDILGRPPREFRKQRSK